MNITTKIGEARLESSASFFLAHGNTSFTVSIEDIELAFVFIGEDNDPAVQASIDPNNGKRINITLSNWANPLGTSNVFRDIAIIGDKAATLTLSVMAIKSDSRMGRRVNYSVTSMPYGDA